MRQALVLALVGVLLGFSPSHQGDGSVAEYAPDEGDLGRHALVGNYYQGDGLGLNLSLTLAEDGSYRCKWRGCLGDYGTTEGVWSLSGDRVEMRADVLEGMFEMSPLQDLEVVDRRDGVVLVQVGDQEWFDRHGPSPANCFQRREGR